METSTQAGIIILEDQEICPEPAEPSEYWVLWYNSKDFPRKEPIFGKADLSWEEANKLFLKTTDEIISKGWYTFVWFGGNFSFSESRANEVELIKPTKDDIEVIKHFKGGTS